MSIEYFSFLLQTDSKFRIKSENHFSMKKVKLQLYKVFRGNKRFFYFLLKKVLKFSKERFF